MNKKVLIIGFVWPEPKSSAAGSRMLQLIDAFLSYGYQITFASPSTKNDNTFDLGSLGVLQKVIALNNSSFDDFVRTLNPDMVLFDRFMMEEQFGWRVAEQCPKALRVLDTEDLHCLRKGREQAFKDNKPFNKHYLFNDVAKREIASIYRCDLSLIISEAEMHILKNDFAIDTSLLVYLPFMLEELSTETIKNLPEFEKRKHFITIGNFLHTPNYNAVLFLKEAIWPLIRKQLPDAELHIYGAYASQKVNQLHNEKQGFLVKGFANNANEVMKTARICLAPIRFGAGLKGKLIDAMQNGTPSITTTIGAEGMFEVLKPNGFVEDDYKLFAKRAIALYQDDFLWKEKQHNGFLVINQRFSKLKFYQRFLVKLEETCQHLDKLRLNNFTGQMLQHHTMQATKFMGKWIEEKNKYN